MRMERKVCAYCEHKYQEHKNLGYDHFEPYRCNARNGRECSDIFSTTCDLWKKIKK